MYVAPTCLNVLNRSIVSDDNELLIACLNANRWSNFPVSRCLVCFLGSFENRGSIGDWFFSPDRSGIGYTWREEITGDNTVCCAPLLFAHSRVFCSVFFNFIFFQSVSSFPEPGWRK